MTMQNSIGRLDKTQSIPFTSAPAASAPVGSQTTKVRLVATTACFISIGAAVSVSLPAGLPEYFTISPSQVVTVIQATAAGTLCLTEIV
jgi:hypothetical protein